MSPEIFWLYLKMLEFIKKYVNKNDKKHKRRV